MDFPSSWDVQHVDAMDLYCWSCGNHWTYTTPKGVNLIRPNNEAFFKLFSPCIEPFRCPRCNDIGRITPMEVS